MTFDPKLKELARAQDAVDRLREVDRKIREDNSRREARRDAVIRLVILSLTGAILAVSVRKL